MTILHRIEYWGTTHHPKWLVVLRVILGICLFVKGISFANDTAEIQQLLAEDHITQTFPWLAYFITWAHLFGGFMIIIGLLTRFAILLQLPILLGAIFFVSRNDIIFSSSYEFVFTLAVLLLLIFFIIEGGGPVSLDNYFKKNPK